MSGIHHVTAIAGDCRSSDRAWLFQRREHRGGPSAGTLAGAALLRAMVPLSDPPHPDLSGVPVLIASGKVDPIVPAPNSTRLAAMLRDAGADVSHQALPVGHQLSRGDVALVRDWLATADVQKLLATR
jgi:phospholipase/carboxylesterase